MNSKILPMLAPAALAAAMLAGCGPQAPANGPAAALAPAQALAGTTSATPAGATSVSNLPPAPNDGVPPPPVVAPQQQGTPVPARAPAGAGTMAVAAPRQVAQAAPAPRAAPVGVFGEVRSVEPIRERPPGTGKGAVIGGLLGGVVGNQFGHGNGRAAMTVLGAAGGAVAGNNVERNINKRIVGYRVSVRLDNGQIRTYEEKSVGDLRAGDRVRIEGKHVRPA